MKRVGWDSFLDWGYGLHDLALFLLRFRWFSVFFMFLLTSIALNSGIQAVCI